MPTCCDECCFYDDNWDYPTCSITGSSRGYNFPIRERRMPDCPIEDTNKNVTLPKNENGEIKEMDINNNDENEEEDVYVFTPWGCLTSVLNDYNIDISHITPAMGRHMVDDFMELMEMAGYVSKSEDNIN